MKIQLPTRFTRFAEISAKVTGRTSPTPCKYRRKPPYTSRGNVPQFRMLTYERVYTPTSGSTPYLVNSDCATTMNSINTGVNASAMYIACASQRWQLSKSFAPQDRDTIV